MTSSVLRGLVPGFALAIAAACVQAAPSSSELVTGSVPRAGWLCCNMRASHLWLGDRDWISDGNYRFEGAMLVPLGTPMVVMGWLPDKPYDVHLLLAGQPFELGNDYSRDVPPEQFVKRYLATTDPAVRLAAFAPEIRQSIQASRIRIGMTREQVFMALGMPIVSMNARDDAPYLRYWTHRTGEFWITFANDRVTRVDTDTTTRAEVLDE